jgi:hypothetical protein
MVEGNDPIDDEELLYRRIPVSQNWYDPASTLPPSPKAFKPHRTNDASGLSLYRARFKTAQEVAANDREARFYVAVLKAGDLRRRGVEVLPRPLPGDPGHAELPDLRSDNRDQTRCLELQLALTRLCVSIEGPYP